MNAKSIKELLIIVTILLICLSSNIYSCTTFCLKNGYQIVYGRNFDFDLGNGFVATNRKNLSKEAFLLPDEKPISWVSKYGSITFNQMGMEFPYEGINEQGLVVAQLSFKATKYPTIDNRKAIHCLQWIQYQLDVSSSINDVIASDTLLRISNRMPVGVHFLVCDKSGNTATIEFLGGKLVCHTGETLPIPLLQNQSYDISYEYLKKFTGFGGDQIIPWKDLNDFQKSNDSLQLIQKNKFVVAANQMKNYDNSKTIIENAFEVLNVVTDNRTQWSSVYDISNMKIHFKNNKHNEVITIDFKDFSFDKNSKSKILDIQSCSTNNILKQFVDYSYELNRKYVLEYYDFMKSQNSMIYAKIPLEYIEMQANYPETITIYKKNH